MIFCFDLAAIKISHRPRYITGSNPSLTVELGVSGKSERAYRAKAAYFHIRCHLANVPIFQYMLPNTANTQ